MNCARGVARRESALINSWTRALAPASLLLATAGCANYAAVAEFAGQTSQVTALVRAELGQLDALCVDQAELTIVLGDISDEGPLKTCLAFQASQGRLAEVTLDVLDDYAAALGALADQRHFDLTTDPATTRARASGLKNGRGEEVANAREVSALMRVVDLLASLQVQSDRQAAVRRMVYEAPQLEVAGRILRSFFVPDPQAPVGRNSAPYGDIVGLTLESTASSQRLLRSKAFQTAEPIRTNELLRAMRSRQASLQARQGTGAGTVPAAMAAALDAWLAAVNSFSAQALKPDASDLARQLKALRAQAGAARQVVQSATP
jgi:hypothetical protein